jgi:hypothetical protein
MPLVHFDVDGQVSKRALTRVPQLGDLVNWQGNPRKVVDVQWILEHEDET